jgi:hypothetical protein
MLTEKETSYAVEWFTKFMAKYGPCDIHSYTTMNGLYMFARAYIAGKSCTTVCAVGHRELELEREQGGGIPTLLQFKSPELAKGLGDRRFDTPQIPPQTAE